MYMRGKSVEFMLGCLFCSRITFFWCMRYGSVFRSTWMTNRHSKGPEASFHKSWELVLWWWCVRNGPPRREPILHTSWDVQDARLDSYTIKTPPRGLSIYVSAFFFFSLQASKNVNSTTTHCIHRHIFINKKKTRGINK